MFDTSFFAIKSREAVKKTPFIKISIDIDIKIFPVINVLLVVNKNNNHVNLMKLFSDLENGIGVHKRKYNDWKSSQFVVKYVDIYSLLHYGHLHYSYNDKPIYVTNDYSKPLNIDELKIVPEIYINDRVASKTKGLSEANEIYGDIYKGNPTECRGQYGEYHLIGYMMNYISIYYMNISTAFVKFVGEILDNNEFVNVCERVDSDVNCNVGVTDSASQYNSNDCSDVDVRSSCNESYDSMMYYIKQLIPDIVTLDNSVCLLSNTLKLMIYVNRNEFDVNVFKNKMNEHAECYVYVCIDLCDESNLTSHLEFNPLCIYINCDDFNMEVISFICNICVYYKNNTIEYDNIQIVKSVYESKIDKIANEFACKLMTRLENELNNRNNSIIDYINNDNKSNDYSSVIRDFVKDNRDKYKTGYYVSKSYTLYTNWCSKKNKYILTAKEFKNIMNSICYRTTLNTDPYTKEHSTLQYWIEK